MAGSSTSGSQVNVDGRRRQRVADGDIGQVAAPGGGQAAVQGYPVTGRAGVCARGTARRPAAGAIVWLLDGPWPMR